ncbi:uncharacterized protein METZ01_LOCUS259921, partial [marine metagenome]
IPRLIYLIFLYILLYSAVQKKIQLQLIK